MSEDAHYLATRKIVKKKKRGVGNNSAKRGVKLGRDFLSMARTEEKFRNICL